jgi:hypothetical protein
MDSPIDQLTLWSRPVSSDRTCSPKSRGRSQPTARQTPIPGSSRAETLLPSARSQQSLLPSEQDPLEGGVLRGVATGNVESVLDRDRAD